MLFVQLQDVVFRLKLYDISCMMDNFTSDVHGEVHIWHLDTMQRGTDGHNNTQNGLVRIGIKFYSQMSVAMWVSQCLQPNNRQKRVWRQSGQVGRLRRTVQQVQQGGGSLMFWGGIIWGRRTPQVIMEGAETAIRYRNDILQPILQQIGRISTGISLTILAIIMHTLWMSSFMITTSLD